MIYFLLYLLIEMIVSYEFMSVFTPIGMFIETIVSAIAGVMIIQRLDMSLRENIYRFSNTQIEQLASIGVLKLVGAMLLIVPGIFTDIIGILLQFDRVVALFIKPTSSTHSRHTKTNTRDDIIDVEIIE
ncbi:MAG: FxsA family protein [Epsilonproteobacteria bacterium]|nr:FxsA family protein [Campylobacterota bacterium]